MPASPLPEPRAGTLRVLVSVSENRRARGVLDAVIVLATIGLPSGAWLSMGDDIVNSDGDFGDDAHPAEFANTKDVTSGLWIVEWDWTIAPQNAPEDDEDYDDEVYIAANYGSDRWTRPTLADLIAFQVLPEEPSHV